MACDPHTRSDDTMTAAEMRDMLDLEDDEPEPAGDTIPTHSGEWRREGEVWRWWQHNDVED